MRRTGARRLFVGLLVVAVSIGGLGAAGMADAPSKEKPKKKHPPVVLDEATLGTALLAIEDMPTGWAQDPSATPDVPDAASGPCNGPNEAAHVQAAGVVADGQVTFRGGPSSSPFLTEKLFAFPNAKATKALMQAHRESLKPCNNSWQIPGPDGRPATVTAAPIPFPNVADDTLALQFTVSEPEINLSSVADIILVRRGNHALSFLTTGTTVEETQPFVQKALKKLGVALKAAKAKEKVR